MKSRRMQRSTWLLPLFLAILSFPGLALAQQQTVRGQVLAAGTQAPVLSAVVEVQGSGARTLTDNQGRFTVQVPSPNATLVITALGFSSDTVAVNGQNVVSVLLRPDAVELSGLVVVGYGTQRRSDVTGAIATVDRERLARTPAASVTQILQGSVPGLQMNLNSAGAEANNLSIQVRGRTSIKAGNSPLVVVDGIPYGGALSEINPNDIASVDVLKDASSAAIYGSRAANGVILITTKKGSAGPARLSYDGYAGVQDYINLPPVMSAQQFAEFKCVREAGQTPATCYRPWGEGGAFEPSELAMIEAGQSTNWLEEASRQGFQQQHNLSLSGGSDQTRYFISGSLLNVNGVAKGDEFDRYTLRLNVDQDVKSWFRLGTSTQLSHADRSGIPADWDKAYFSNPLTSAYDPEGDLTIFPFPELQDPFFGNPLGGVLVKNENWSRRVLSSNFAEIDLPVEGLSLRLNGGIDYQNEFAGEYWARNTARGYSENGESRVTDQNDLDWTTESILNYNRAFGNHTLGVTALYGMQSRGQDERRVVGYGYALDNQSWYQAQNAQRTDIDTNVADYGLISQMGRINYGYDGRYLVTLTARRDGASVFGANHKYGVFPSVAVAWNIGRESFMDGVYAVNDLKLRASYGRNGSQAIGPYSTLARVVDRNFLDVNGNNVTTAVGAQTNSLANPGLHWETTDAANVGVDFGLLNGRISGSLDVYKQSTSGLLLDRSISPIHGMPGNVTQNIGKTANQGVELQLSTVNIDRENFSWTTIFNISANRNEIVALYGDGQDDLGNRWFIGEPIRVHYGREFGGIWQVEEAERAALYGQQPGDIRAVDQNDDGKIDSEDDILLHGRDPSYIAGLGTTLRFGKVSLDGFLSTVQGVTRTNPLRLPNVYNQTVRNATHREWWTPENRSNINPANRAPSDGKDVNAYAPMLLEDASFVRLRDVTLSYDFGDDGASRLGLSGMRLYVSGRNLLTLTSWEGMDPELDGQRAIPLERTILAGLRVGL